MASHPSAVRNVVIVGRDEEARLCRELTAQGVHVHVAFSLQALESSTPLLASSAVG